MWLYLLKRVLLCSLLLFALITSASASVYAPGDVFASVGGGVVNVYSQTGVFKQQLNTGLGGFTTGSTFDKSGNFYVTAFSANRISKFDNNGSLVNASWASGISAPESIVFDASGNAYIGNAGASQIKKVNSSGVQIALYNTSTNTDWIDLAADQTTILYSDESNTLRLLDTSSNTNSVFTNGSGPLFAKRYMPNGDVLAASGTGNVYRWNSSGILQQTYNIGIGSVFALNLDPNGTSFWTGTTGGQQIKKVNIATGATEQSWSTGTGTLYGLSVFGEIQAGGGGSGIVPEPMSVFVWLGLAFTAINITGRRERL